MMMAKPKTGNILQVTLPNGLGYAYGESINLLETNSNSRYPILLRIFNYRSITPEINLDQFHEKELILCPLLIAGLSAVLKDGTWRIVGHISINDDHKKIPHFKKAYPDEDNAKEWYYVEDADISKRTRSTYENVKHLETIGAIGASLAPTKIAMALLQDEGKNIENHISLREYFETRFINDVRTIVPYYKQPDWMKGRAI